MFEPLKFYYTNSEHSSHSRVANNVSSYGRDMVQNGLGFMHSIFKISWSDFVVHEITPVSGEPELFPVGIGQVKRNSIKTHGTSCYVTGELIARRYFLKQENEEIEN